MAVAAAAAAVAAVSWALADSCESRHVLLLSGGHAADPDACAALAERIAEFNASCPMHVPELDCG